jgi:AP2 domain
MVPLHGKAAAGRVALVDDKNVALVNQYRWRIRKKSRCAHGRRFDVFYAQATVVREDGRRTTIGMHCLIMDRTGIDHRNGNGLDNQEHNLRVATPAQNMANARSFLGSSSAYKGVSWHKPNRSWYAKITVNKHQKNLGYFTTEEDAARAYDVAALAAWGEFARLNFKEAK